MSYDILSMSYDILSMSYDILSISETSPWVISLAFGLSAREATQMNFGSGIT